MQGATSTPEGTQLLPLGTAPQPQTAHTKIGSFWRQEFTARFCEVAVKLSESRGSQMRNRFCEVIRRSREGRILRRHVPPCSERGSRWRGEFTARHLEVQHRSDQPPETDRNECRDSTDQSICWVLNQRIDDRELHQKVLQLASQALLNGGSKLAAAVFAGCRPNPADLQLFEQLSQLSVSAPAEWSYKHTRQCAFDSLTDLKAPDCCNVAPQLEQASECDICPSRARPHVDSENRLSDKELKVRRAARFLRNGQPVGMQPDLSAFTDPLSESKQPAAEELIVGNTEQPTIVEDSHPTSAETNGLLSDEEVADKDGKDLQQSELCEMGELMPIVSGESCQDFNEETFHVLVNQGNDDKKENIEEQPTSGFKVGSLGNRKVTCASLQYYAVLRLSVLRADGDRMQEKPALQRDSQRSYTSFIALC